jgi:uncharacterized membrane protein YkvA (DUF1232 family)
MSSLEEQTMAAGVTSWLTRPGLLRRLWSQARLAIRLLREPRVPVAIKAVVLLAALYVIFPLDFLPDFLPGLGQLDDLGIAAVALELFLKLCPAGPKAFHAVAITQGRHYAPMPATDDVIEAEWRRG